MDELLIEPEPTERELGTAPIKPLFARYAAITVSYTHLTLPTILLV